MQTCNRPEPYQIDFVPDVAWALNLLADTVVDGGADDWDDPARDGATQLEVVLYREEPEIRLRAVPVERARLVKRLVSEQRTITEELRKERVEVDQPPSSSRP